MKNKLLILLLTFSTYSALYSQFVNEIENSLLTCPLRSIVIVIPVLPARGPFSIAKIGYEQFFSKNSRFTFNIIYEKTFNNNFYKKMNSDGLESEIKIHFGKNRLLAFVGLNFGINQSNYTYHPKGSSLYYDYNSSNYNIGLVKGFKILSKRGYLSPEFSIFIGRKYFQATHNQGINDPYLLTAGALGFQFRKDFLGGYPLRSGVFNRISLNFSIKILISSANKINEIFSYQ